MVRAREARMKLLFCIAALSIMLGGCAKSPTRSEVPGLSKDHADAMQRQYADCLDKTADHYSSLNRGSPSEIAEAVLADCEGALAIYRRALMNQLTENMSTQRGKLFAIEKTDELMQ